MNKSFSNGRLFNPGSLEFAVKNQARSKNWIKTAAIFIRAILIDHPFEDGNKRTAANVWMLIMELNKVPYNPEAVPRIITRILLKNMTNIQTVERLIKDAIR